MNVRWISDDESDDGYKDLSEDFSEDCQMIINLKNLLISYMVSWFNWLSGYVVNLVK